MIDSVQNLARRLEAQIRLGAENREITDKDLLSKVEEVKKAWMSLPRDKKVDFFDDLLGETDHKFIRDWVVTDSRNWRNSQSPTVITHLLTGVWRGFNMTFDHAVDSLKEHPEQDGELLRVIYET